MFCEKCGKQINDDAIFCPFCGYSMALPTDNTARENNDLNTDKSEHVKVAKKTYNPVIFKILGIGFFLLAILEFGFRYVLAIRKFTDYHGISVYFSSFPCLRIYSVDKTILKVKGIGYLFKSLYASTVFLLGPVSNILFCVYCLFERKVIYLIASIYGMVTAVIITAAVSRDRYYMFTEYGGDYYLEEIRDSIIVCSFAIIMFIFVLCIYWARKPAFFVLGGVFAAAHSVTFTLNFSELGPTLVNWIFYTNFHAPAIYAVIVTVAEIVIYSLFILLMYKRSRALKDA